MAINGMLKQKFALTEINSRKVVLDKNEAINKNLLEIHLGLQQIVNWTGAGIDEKSIVDAIKKNGPLINKIAKERVKDELFKIISSPNPYQGISLLKETGLLGEILPELEKGKYEPRPSK